ncbi:MAG TPA: MerR family transcriptional regulator [Bryobacteraceae bacterium]|nr:MerR family transcriptional regulator [Bryobacteraceae bacterium]
MPTLYPIRAVAKLTGIPVDTLRAWERRYHAVTPDRSARGRQYSDAEVRRLLLLRTAVDGGHAIGQVAALSDAELQDLARAPFASRSDHRPDPGARAANPNLQPLLDAIAAFDCAAINEELSRLALLLSPAGIVHQVVLPLMRLTGENWENGTFQIAQEHMFSACLRNLLGGLVRLQRQGNGAVRMLLTTPSDELHEFGILAAAMLAVAQDFQVTYLGPNLPPGEIVSAAEKCAANVVVLGIMKTNATPAVKRDMTWLMSELPVSTELWAGGTGAAEVFGGVARGGTFILEDLADFERHLSRWKTAPSQEPAR